MCFKGPLSCCCGENCCYSGPNLRLIIVTFFGCGRVGFIYWPRQSTRRLYFIAEIVPRLVTAWFVQQDGFVLTDQITFCAAVFAPLLIVHTAHTVLPAEKCYFDGSTEQSMRRACHSNLPPSQCPFFDRPRQMTLPVPIVTTVSRYYNNKREL
jgi:hypothetical protein